MDAVGAASMIDDAVWDDLVAYLDDRRIIPVIDTGALLVGEGAERQPLESLLARRLAERLKLGMEGSGWLRLDEVVRRQRVGGAGRKENLHVRLQQVMRELDLAPPPALLELASIEALDLFVSVSFDDLLVTALDRVRHGGASRTETIAFAPNRSPDLPRPRRDGHGTTVFQLLGRLSSSANESVICDDDRLEFLHALQDDARRPKLLFDELRESHLLLIGCRLPDWAARFFLRTARGGRLSASGSDAIELLVGRDVGEDPALASFLAAFRPGATLLAVEPEDFIHELARRWRDAHPADAAPAAQAAAAPSGGQPTDAAVFVSYNRADGDAAARLVARLRGAGVEVWFDRNDIRYGDPWADRIIDGIQQASLFIPIISANTQSEDRGRSYFWREWNMAADLAAGMAPSERFILPVVIDATEPYRANVPRRFTSASFATFPGGEPDSGFVTVVKSLFDDYRKRIGHG